MGGASGKRAGGPVTSSEGLKEVRSKGASARVLGAQMREMGLSTSTAGVKIGGSAPFAPAKVGLGTRKHAVPRSGNGALAASTNVRSCTGALLPLANAADKVFTQSLRESCYVEPQRLALPAVLDVLHAMAGRPDRKYMITNDYHSDDVEMLRLLPTEPQLEGAGLHDVSAAIKEHLRGWDVVMRSSDPHGVRGWTAHEVARFFDSFRERLGAAQVALYRRRVLMGGVSGARLLAMSRAHLKKDLQVLDPFHQQVIYNKIDMMRTLKRWSPQEHGHARWPRDLKLVCPHGQARNRCKLCK